MNNYNIFFFFFKGEMLIIIFQFSVFPFHEVTLKKKKNINMFYNKTV